MAINIAAPLFINEDIDFTISHEDAQLIKLIRDKVGLVAAIRVLRMYNNKCGLRQAKRFVEEL